jgi:hypothetical protein
MKYLLILINLIAINFLAGCAFNMKCELGFVYQEVCEDTYWKTPCFVSGRVMKNKPEMIK